MKSYWHFMVAKFVRNCVLVLAVGTICSYVVAEECTSTFDDDSAMERPGLLFDGIVIPILDGYVFRPKGNARVYIDSHKCWDIVQDISIVDIQDCILCSASAQELREVGFEFIDAGDRNGRYFRFLTSNGQTVLVIWNSESALNIKDQNYDYLLYIVNLYMTD